MIIREATDADLADVMAVEKAAFADDSEANLVRDLLKDPTAKPHYSLLALHDDKAVGHILFTAAALDSTRDNPAISLLAPLAVIPEFQNQGIGGALIRHGLEQLSNRGVDLVFVLGHPAYYPRFGFNPAGIQGFEAPFPILQKNADAWMVQALKSGILGQVSGKVRCAEILNKPEYWQE